MDKKAQEGTDDAELANMLAGMNANQPTATSGLQFEESPLPPPAADATVPAPEPAPDQAITPMTDDQTVTPQDTAPAPEVDYTAPTPEPATPAADTPPAFDATAPTTEPTAPVPASANPELESIRQEALNNLRPLVDKLDLPPEEHFDTLLLVIRSTDDQSLVPQAFAAAKAITDETRRAQALLDIIKEIDFFNSQTKA